ncbi:MAG: caspase family protein [Woeseiaceae bacterium]
MFSHISRVIAVFLIIMPAMAALAEQRALLVGVGKYSVPGIDLPGIDLDLERMQDTLNLMGFDDSQIHSLLDDQATSKNVFRELEIWLRQGVKPEDRVVFYFSGHGSNTPDLDGDEADGVDEVLVTHDVRRVRRDGRAALTGVVTDDKLASLIAGIPSENVWIIVDACHSGTISRGVTMDNLTLGTDTVFVKSFTYTGMPEGKQFVFDREFQKDGESNFVSISAAADGEKAIGTSSGGVFTIGLTKAIAEVAKTGGAVTVNQLRDYAAAYIRDHVDANRVHNPQVNGSETLAAGTLKIVPVTTDNGPNRKRLIKMVAEQQKEFTLESSKIIYVVDDPVEFTLEIPIDGYLNVVTVDSHDDATVLYPNQFNPENTVKQGTFRFPTEEASFTLPASEPLGSTLVAAFVTQDPINFYTQTLDDRDEHGNVNVTFTTLSHIATRAIRVAPRKTEMYAEMLELSVIAKE